MKNDEGDSLLFYIRGGNNWKKVNPKNSSRKEFFGLPKLLSSDFQPFLLKSVLNYGFKSF